MNIGGDNYMDFHLDYPQSGDQTMKTLHNSDVSGARQNVKDIKVVGNVMTGDFTPNKAALACLKAYVDMSDGELETLGMTRDHCLNLAREYIGSKYADAELATIFDQIAVAFVLGKKI